MPDVLGIDVGGTKLLARVEDADGRCALEFRRQTGRGTGVEGLLNLVADVLRECRARRHDVRAVGLGFPGLVDSRQGIVLSSVILDGWKDVPFQAVLERSFGVPARVANDVKNAARAELSVRPEAAGELMLIVAIGSGIGGAIAYRGEIIDGAAGLAGEIGHFSVSPDGPSCACGRRGCVGPQAAGESIERSLGLHLGQLTACDPELDPVKTALREAAEQIGWVLGNALNLLSPSRVIFAGGLAGLGERFLGRIEARARAECFPEIAARCRFEASRLGDSAGAVGSAILARSALRETRQ